MEDPLSEPNPRRLALRAAFLVLPLVLAAVGLPHLRRWAAPSGAVPAAREATRAAEDAAPEGTAPPARGDHPTAAELEAARDADVALAKAQRWEKAETLAPREGVPDASGDLVRPFQGFGLSVDSSPAGARVVVNGQHQGETPLLTSVDCAPGGEVEVRVERAGHRAFRRVLACRADSLLSFTVRLRPAR